MVAATITIVTLITVGIIALAIGAFTEAMSNHNNEGEM
jgi:hypothetical protein